LNLSEAKGLIKCPFYTGKSTRYLASKGPSAPIVLIIHSHYFMVLQDQICFTNLGA